MFLAPQVRVGLPMATAATAVYILLSSTSVGTQGGLRQQMPGDEMVLVADFTNKFTRVAAPDGFRLGTAAATATINVTYTGFTTEAQAAFQQAVNIWQTQISSTVPIEISAEFKVLGTGVLGSASSNFVYANFANASPSTWYQAALANRLAGIDLDPFEHDIDANFNSGFVNWYFGTDGNTPAGQFDFVTVVLHEIAHGLGFSGLMNVSGGLGSWGTNGFPYIYDRFVENGSMQAIINTALFANPSTSLAAQLTGNDLYWNGTNGKSGNGGVHPRLYAPATWSSGSSIAHLDEATYPAGNLNSLMTPALGLAESIHEPGPIARGIFTDIGWDQCEVSLSPTSQTVESSGGMGSVAVTADTSCGWAAASNNDFITVTSGTTGSGNGTVNYTVAANSDNSGARVGTLTIGGETFTLTQTGCPAQISGTTTSFGTGGGSGSATLLADATCDWTASSSAAWLTITAGSTGSGNGTVSYTVAANSGINRGGTLLIGVQPYFVAQSGCAASILPTTATSGIGGGTADVAVTADAGCTWEASSNASWLTVTGGASGSGAGTVSYAVAANPGTGRTGSLIIAGDAHTVTQAGCSTTLSPASASFDGNGGSGSITVTRDGNCAWTAINTPNWITITSGGTGSGSGTLSYTVAENSALPRTGTLTIAGQTFSVSQAACAASISPSSALVGNGTNAGSVSVTAGDGCAWTAFSAADWITVTAGGDGPGNGTVGYTVSANPGSTARAGALSVAGHPFTVTQAVAFTDEDLTSADTPVRAVHITELRDRINAVRVANGLEALIFTDPTLTAGVTQAKGGHITELRTALAAAYLAAGETPPTYTDPDITAAATLIRAVHITKLRAAVAALE